MYRSFAFLTLLLTCLMAIPARAQYEPLPLDSGHVWMMEYYPPYGGPYVSHIKTVKTIGETTVFGRRYAVLSDGNLIRNDTARRRVYGIPRELGVDTLLFDFSLQRGDTVQGWYSICQSNIQDGCATMPVIVAAPIVIRSEDSVIIAGRRHRRVYIQGRGASTPFPNAWIVEGIGSSAGLFHKINQLVDSSSNLICLDGNVVNDQYTQCRGIMSVRSGLSAEARIRIVQEGTRRLLEVEIGHPVRIDLFASDGKRVLAAERVLPGERVPLPACAPGLYVVSLTGPASYARQKLVVE